MFLNSVIKVSKATKKICQIIFILGIFAIFSFSSLDANATTKKVSSNDYRFVEYADTYLFDNSDGTELFMDIYNPIKGSQTSIDGKEKPTIIFIFGGGFKGGKRDNKEYLPWFKTMTNNGYRIISIDYRLGLKNCTKVGIGALKDIHNAIHMAVVDLFCAVDYIIKNAGSLNIDPNNLVISGSSAGAITALQADYELCNHSKDAALMPEGFKFAGVMAFSGAVLSQKGRVKYQREPAPTLFLHGTKDKIVTYKSIRFFNWGFFGAHKLTKRFKRFGYNYNTLRYLGHGHDIANSMNKTVPEQLIFLENNVMKHSRRIVDSVIDDPKLVYKLGFKNLKELYAK